MNFSQRNRHLIHERANDACERCGTYGAKEIRFRLQPSLGGRPEVSNGILLCGRVTCAMTDNGRYGIVLPASIKPAEAPVCLIAPGGGFRWFMLTDDGDKLYVPTATAHDTMLRLGVWDEAKV